MSTPPPAKRIGELNGPWAFLLRLALSTYPLVIAWGVWVTVATFEAKAFMSTGDRFTSTDAAQLELRLMSALNGLPQEEWRDRVRALEANQATILRTLDSIQTTLSHMGKTRDGGG